MTAEGLLSESHNWALIAYLCGDNPQLEAHIRTQVNAVLAFAGSSQLRVAAQWDLPDRTERAARNQSNVWERERLERVNTGDPEPFIAFLRWAFDRFPTERVIVVVSGTGLLDQRATIGGPETDRSHLFTVCHDASAGDALSLSEVGSLFRRALDLSMRDKIDILAFDMRELQCLEVAYELEESVDTLIAPQTRIPDAGWDFAEVLRQCDAALLERQDADFSVHRMARLLVRTVGAGYSANHDGNLSLSALNLRALKPVASAFDTLSLAMVQAVGEDLVWKAREAVAKRLKRSTAGADARGTHSWDEQKELEAEIEYLYDLPEMLAELLKEFEETARTGLVQLFLDYFKKLDASGFEEALQSIDNACFAAGARLRQPGLERTIANPVEIHQRLAHLMTLAHDSTATWSADANRIQGELASLITNASSESAVSASWICEWPDEVVATLPPPLVAMYRGAQRQLQRLGILALLTDRVLALLRGGATDFTHAVIEPLVLEHYVSVPPDTPVRHGGVSLYRPRNLDQLIASDYLALRFNKKIHWTVLLAVINLIGNYPRELWRILSSVLLTADNNTRAQLIDRIAGPGSVIAQFREQFVVLAPFKTFVLSLEPDLSVVPATTLKPPTEELANGPQPRAYRVRLELAERDAFISEVLSIVDPQALDEVIKGLERLLEPGTAMDATSVRAIESLGKSFGEDILQDLGIKLADSAATGDRLHLQLQIPRDLMHYPWELMQHKSGWLAEDFALGRQIFSRTAVGTARGRVPGALRALVIGNPQSQTPVLSYAVREAAIVSSALEALASETDGLIDFKTERDAYINQPLTRDTLRELLRHGNYDIVHFAGHAAFDRERPESSAWLLSDGPFSAQLIRNTLRWRETQPWLVFANACEAARDDPTKTYQTDVFGLASAFLDNGVGVFIGPLWQIDDDVAAELARNFYSQLLKERQTVGEALRYAKAQAKRNNFDPVLARRGDDHSTKLALVSWAGLVLYGNSTTTIGQRMGAPSPPAPMARTHERED